jgi:exosortase C (VPDSG-CTERM-specific)
MNTANETTVALQGNSKTEEISHRDPGRAVWPTQTFKFVMFVIVLVACFWGQLRHLWQDASNSFYYSYITMVPYLVVGLIYLDRMDYPQRASRGVTGMSACAVAGVALLFLDWRGNQNGIIGVQITNQVLTTAAFVLFLAGAAFLFFGNAFMRKAACPTALLAFMVPPPPIVLAPALKFMQVTSAQVAQFFLWLFRTPVTKHGTILTLPNIDLAITPACSGFHAGVIMFILILVAGHMLLRSGWSRLWLAAVVVPIAIVRNGFRIFVLSELCVHYGAKEIDSPLHSKGGPLFFALFLIPMIVLLIIFKRKERLPDAQTFTNT